MVRVRCVPPQIQVHHPAAKTMIEISRTQDEEVGDGTTSVIILGELFGWQTTASRLAVWIVGNRQWSKLCGSTCTHTHTHTHTHFHTHTFTHTHTHTQTNTHTRTYHTHTHTHTHSWRDALSSCTISRAADAPDHHHFCVSTCSRRYSHHLQRDHKVSTIPSGTQGVD